jgi:alkylation response protein AidB-like acyl-CoA dehydrogenase
MTGQNRDTTASLEQLKARIHDLLPSLAEAYPIRDEGYEFPHEEIRMLKAEGFMKLTVPKNLGGFGATATDSIAITQQLAQAFPSLAQVLAVHTAMVSTLIAFGSPDQTNGILKRVVEEDLFIGNATSEKGSNHAHSFETVFEDTEGGIFVSGQKFFTTGSPAADLLLVFGRYEDKLGVAVTPADAEGIVIQNDWRAMGQRGTGSGGIQFKNVFVPRDAQLASIDFQNLPAASVIGPIYQVGFSAMYVGIANGALESAVQYIRTRSRPWMDSNVDRAVEDPYVLAEIGTMNSYLRAAEALVAQAARAIDEVGDAVQQGLPEARIADLRAQAATTAAQAKVVATEVALRVCQDIFQTTGARSTLTDQRLDRFWRDARTLTLHDPKPYKARLVGEVLLQGKTPPVSMLT